MPSLYLLLLKLAGVYAFVTAASAHQFAPSPPRHDPPPADTARARALVGAADDLLRSSERASMDGAIDLLEEAVRLAPGYEPALVALAETHYRRADMYGLPPAWYDTAAVYAERVVPLNPARGWLLLGQILGLKGEHDFALEALERSVEHDPTSFPATFALGYRYFDLGRHDRGIPVQIRAAALAPEDRAVRNLLGFSYLHIGQPELARRWFDESVALRVTGFSVGGQMMIRLARRDFAGAVAYTEGVLRDVPEMAWAWARLGEAHLFAGNASEAARAYEEALARDSSSTNIYTWKATALPLAYLHLKEGRAAEAAPLIERSYRHADDMMRRGQEPWNAFYHYAALALMRGGRAEALRWLRSAHAVGMPGPVLIEFDPLLAGLREDPEFEEIVQRLRWREQEIQRRLGLTRSGGPPDPRRSSPAGRRAR